jgi:hypothetical protein
LLIGLEVATTTRLVDWATGGHHHLGFSLGYRWPPPPGLLTGLQVATTTWLVDWATSGHHHLAC